MKNFFTSCSSRCSILLAVIFLVGCLSFNACKNDEVDLGKMFFLEQK